MNGKEKSSTLKRIGTAILENKRWIVLSIVVTIFVLIAEAVLQKEILVFDSAIYSFLVQHRTNFLNILFKFITQFGSAIYIIVITFLCVIFIKNKKYKKTIPLNLVVITWLNLLMKNIFLRPRPNELRIIEETGFSFPSGHSMVSMAFYGYFIYLICKNMKNKYLKYTLCALLSILILLIGLSRIYLGVHYASDVVAGLCFSMAYLIFMIGIGVYM